MISKLKVWVDGSCKPNPGHMGIGIYAEYADYDVMGCIIGAPKKILEKSIYKGEGTNQLAELLALNEALEFLLHPTVQFKYKLTLTDEVLLYMDSEYAYNQVWGKWRCNYAHLIEQKTKALAMVDKLKEQGIKLTPHLIDSENNLADRLANEAVML